MVISMAETLRALVLNVSMVAVVEVMFVVAMVPEHVQSVRLKGFANDVASPPSSSVEGAKCPPACHVFGP